MQPEARPEIVSQDWFLDCLEQGVILDASNYKVDVPNY